MIEFKKGMFSCWGNGDKYDDELIIEHDPKIESKIIADQIMDDYEKARKLDQLDAICQSGKYEDTSEFLVKILNNEIRLATDTDKQNQKLRELIEKRRKVAHEMWSATIIREEGVNPSQREFVLDMELEKLLHEVDKK